MPGEYYLILWISFWFLFSGMGIYKKKSKIISIGGGFLASLLILILIWMALNNLNENDKAAPIVQNDDKENKLKSLVPVEWGDSFGSSIAGVMANGYSNWLEDPYVTLLLMAENKSDKTNPNLELHMFTFTIPTILKVCQKNEDIDMGTQSVDANRIALQAKVKCANGKINYFITEKGTQDSPTPLDTMLRSGDVTLFFPDEGSFIFPSTGYAAWEGSKLTQLYIEQVKKDKENLRLNKFYAMHEDKVKDAQKTLAQIFWCEDMGYNMSRFKGIISKMISFAVNHSHPVAYHDNNRRLDEQYSTWPQSIASDVCRVAGHTRYTY